MITCNTLIDNSNKQLKLVSVLTDLIGVPECDTIKIATGYWDIPGTALVLDALRAFLSRSGTKVQMLIGTDPVVRASQQKNPRYKNAHLQKDYLRCDLQHLEVRDEYVATVQLLKEHCKESFADSKIQIKLCETDDKGVAQFFHAKCYIFLGTNFAKGIIGSSNFTQKGLEDNSELNYLEWDNTRVTAVPNEHSMSKGHNYWFDEKWNQAEEWNKTFLEEVLKGCPVEQKAEEEAEKDPRPLTPYELYIKLLNYKFGDIIDLNQQQLIESYLPKKFNPLPYQIQAVKQCFTIMREHGGFMLADVVGLGKTVVGALVIKHFLTLPDDDGRERRVLVVSPPAIASSWRDTILDFDKEAKNKMNPFIDFITTGSIGKLVDGEDIEDDDADLGDFTSQLDYKNYGLIIIDESHKFRNRQTNMYIALDDLIAQIGSATGAYPYIGLLSATPQNNRPADLQNQIYLFERNHADCTLKNAKGGNLEHFFKVVNDKYDALIAAPKDDDGNIRELTPEERKQRQQQLKELSQSIREKVLDDILVRRTRTDIIKYYPDSGLTFPKISGPHSLEYKMESSLARLFAETMDTIGQLDPSGSDYLCYYRYRAIEFLLDENIKQLYKGGNIKPDRFSKQLAHIMQINLVKRIESSFPAFKASLKNLRKYTQNMIDMWQNNTIFICPDIDVNAELDREAIYRRTGKMPSFADCINNIRRKIKRLDEQRCNGQGRNRELTQADFKAEYLDLLQQDLFHIDMLCNSWNDYDNDPKLERFKRSIETELFDPQRNPTRKLVVFTEAIDTARSVCRAIEATNHELKVLTVTADNRDKMENTIRENFDANYHGEWKDDYQVIVTTDVLAEGVNLHRANSIVNYDTPWNATRLMQRIGRVNRIGSKAPFVYVYNFMPSAQGNAQIQLVQKAYTKLQSFHTLFGEDSQVFTEDEEVMHYDLNTQVNGEESPMEKYISELKQYKADHPVRFEQIAAQEDGLQLSLPSPEGISYFLVRNNKMSGMFVTVDAELKTHILSGEDMYRHFRSEREAVAAPLPGDWDKRKKVAERAVNIAINRMNVHVRNSQKATKAKAIIQQLYNTAGLSDDSKRILNTAFQLVNKGNFDIIRKIIAIDAELEQNQSALFALGQGEIDDILSREIKQIVDGVQLKNGEAVVYMALHK